MSTAKKPPAPVISVLNMKGGVGKTTVSAHLMRHLFERLKKSTLLIDFDPQFNLSQTVLARARYDSLLLEGRNIGAVMEPAPSTSLFQVKSGLGPPPSENDVRVELFHFTNTSINLSLVPGSFGLTKYSLIEDSKALLPIRQRFLEFVNATRETRDLICIDCNPSSSFMTLCALMASTHVLVPVRPDRYSVLGLQLLDEFINGLPILTAKPKIIVLLNGIKGTDSDLVVENALRSDPKFGPMVLANSLKFSNLLAASDSHVGFATDKKLPHSSALKTRLSRIVDELKGPLGW